MAEKIYATTLLPIVKKYFDLIGAQVSKEMEDTKKFVFTIFFAKIVNTILFLADNNAGMFIQRNLYLLVAVVLTVMVDLINQKMNINQKKTDIYSCVSFLVGFVALIFTAVLTGAGVIDKVTLYEGINTVIFSYLLPLIALTGFSFTEKLAEKL